MLISTFYVWRRSNHLADKVPVMGYWFASSALIFSTLVSLLAAPSITSLPIVHPKTVSTLVMAVAGGWFALKALKKNPIPL